MSIECDHLWLPKMHSGETTAKCAICGVEVDDKLTNPKSDSMDTEQPSAFIAWFRQDGRVIRDMAERGDSHTIDAMEIAWNAARLWNALPRTPDTDEPITVVIRTGDDPQVCSEIASAALRFIGEDLARRFHEAYERLAPEHGYETRAASSVPWDEVPDNNRALMIAVCEEIFPSPEVQADTVPEGSVVVSREDLNECINLAVCGINPHHRPAWYDRFTELLKGA